MSISEVMFPSLTADGSTHSGGTDCEEGQLRRGAALGGGQYHVTLSEWVVDRRLLAPVNQILVTCLAAQHAQFHRLASYWERH